jgi:hypothetical protein
VITTQQYAEYCPLLLSGFARLARQGFVVPPEYAMDIIHDFFGEEWTNLERTYNPSRGPMKPLVYGAFIRFARKKIMRLHRLEELDLDKVPAIARQALLSDEIPAETSDGAYDLGVIRGAFADLCDQERLVLQRVLAGDAMATIVKTHGITKYRVGECLGRAVIRIALRIGRPDGIRASDWAVSKAIFEGVPAPLIAARNGISRKDVRAINRANINLLVKRLVHANRSAGEQCNH